MPGKEDFTRRLLISMDAKGYGKSDDRQQDAIQTALIRAADNAVQRSGMNRTTWEKQGSGDGELAILPIDVEGLEPRVVEDYPREFAAELALHNFPLRDDMKLRVRMAIHYGVVTPGDNGYVGQGVVAVSRLVDSAPARAALTLADFALILSRQVYADVVIQRHTSLQAKDFRKVTVQNKEYVEEAWLRIPGVDMATVDLEPVPATKPEREPVRESRSEQHASVITNIETAHAPHSVFGISNT